MEFHTNIDGGTTQYDISATNEGDPMTCQKMCQENSECEYWYYTNINKECILRRSFPSSELVFDATTPGFTGTKDCIPASQLNGRNIF